MSEVLLPTNRSELSSGETPNGAMHTLQSSTPTTQQDLNIDNSFPILFFKLSGKRRWIRPSRVQVANTALKEGFNINQSVRERLKFL